MWFRVFGTNECEPDIRESGRPVPAHLHLAHYLTAEDDLRNELNTWAAWIESVPDNPHQNRLMQHMIGTKQLYTIELSEEDRELGVALCQYLAQRTDGVYQVDNQGFFAADGTLLIPEEP